MPDDILTKVDRATMSVGLEARVPILDHNVVQLAAGTPVAFKNRDRQLKYLLRRVLSKYVPRELWDRPKKGFGVPISRWLRTSLKSWAEEELFRSNSQIFDWLDKGELQRVFDDHQTGRFDNKNLIWSCIQLAQWDRMVRRIRVIPKQNL
jgi:asparagine synthase (glutamine-hydrolysing)